MNSILQFELHNFGPERIRDIDESLRAGRALPPDWYTDRVVFEAERVAVLRRSWHYAAHADELKKAGDQIIQKVGGVPIVLLRNEQNEIRGFVNICRHRAHPVVLENQNQRSMQCLYHGWTYGLDGCLRAAPRSRTDPSFDERIFPLMAIQVHQWGPTLWVNLDLNAPNFSDWAEGLPALVAKQGITMDRYRFSSEKTRTIKANWKVFIDNADESYGRALHRHWIFPTTFLRYDSDLGGYDFSAIRALEVDRTELKTVSLVRSDMSKHAEDLRHNSRDDEPFVEDELIVCERAQAAHAAGLSEQLPPRSQRLLLHLREALLGLAKKKPHEKM